MVQAGSVALVVEEAKPVVGIPVLAHRHLRDAFRPSPPAFRRASMRLIIRSLRLRSRTRAGYPTAARRPGWPTPARPRRVASGALRPADATLVGGDRAPAIDPDARGAARPRASSQTAKLHALAGIQSTTGLPGSGIASHRAAVLAQVDGQHRIYADHVARAVDAAGAVGDEVVAERFRRARLGSWPDRLIGRDGRRIRWADYRAEGLETLSCTDVCADRGDVVGHGRVDQAQDPCGENPAPLTLGVVVADRRVGHERIAARPDPAAHVRESRVAGDRRADHRHAGLTEIAPPPSSARRRPSRCASWRPAIRSGPSERTTTNRDVSSPRRRGRSGIVTVRPSPGGMSIAVRSAGAPAVGCQASRTRPRSRPPSGVAQPHLRDRALAEEHAAWQPSLDGDRPADRVRRRHPPSVTSVHSADPAPRREPRIDARGREQHHGHGAERRRAAAGGPSRTGCSSLLRRLPSWCTSSGVGLERCGRSRQIGHAGLLQHRAEHGVDRRRPRARRRDAAGAGGARSARAASARGRA